MQGDFTINEKQQRSLLHLARKSIADRLGLDSSLYDYEEDPLFKEPRGAFVTLHKQGQLRGCIGLIEAVHPVEDTIREMAESAAFKDPRFPSLRADEFSEIDIEISLLSHLFPIKPDAVEVGKHGLVASAGGRRGLLLPQVPVEQGWDRDTFLQHTCLKAGLSPDAWKKEASLEAFTAFVFGEKE